MIDQPPVRLCCMSRHYGPVCPDGLVMCCMCFDRVDEDRLMRDVDDPSLRWDMCLTCGEQENVGMMFRMMAGRA